ncbi:MAG: ATP-binding protein [Pseudomonadota bacterium]
MLLLEKMGIRINLFNKIFFSIIVFFIVFSLISVTIFTRQRTSALEQNLIEDCKHHALIASTNVESGYLINHWPFGTLKEILKSKGVVYWRIIKQDGEICLANDAGMWGKRISNVATRTKKILVKDEIFPETGEKIKVIVNPLNISENGNWTFWLGFSLKSVAEARKRIILTNSVVTAISIILVGLISWYLAKGITVPVKALVAGTRAVSNGELGYKIPVESRDEIGELAISFNKMTESLKRSQDELVVAKEYNEKIVASIPSSLLVLDKDLKIKSVNRTYREIGGIKDEDVVGKNIEEVFPGDLLKEGGLLKAFEDVIETGETRRLYGVKHASSDHPEKILNITVSGIRRAEEEEEEEEDIIMVIEDVTERARLAEEVRKKNKELESFVYTISHDLRAPVISIQGFSSILLSDFQDKLDDTGKRYMARIQANVRQMEILIDDLLEFSRIGRTADTFEDVPSAEIIRDVLNVLVPQLKKRGIKVNVQSGLPVIHCEKTRIYQVFENLIQNSIKYMGDAESPEIEVGCRETGGFHEFYVKDNGIGIDPQYHQKIFQIFQRLKEVDAKGTGVGLATVERIAEIHGGSVRVESEKGKGATFYFTLPGEA